MKEISIEELKKINQSYLNTHHSIRKKDLENIKSLINLIESTRDNTNPKIGDTVKFTSQYGKYYKNALISNIWENGEIEICEKPYIPFVGEYNEKKNNIFLSVSGGIFHTLEPSMFKYLKKDKRRFCNWGIYGPCADGAINFFATVNVWEVKQNMYNKQF